MTAKPLIALTFDDSFITEYSVAFPILRDRGIRATTYTWTRLVRRHIKQPGEMTGEVVWWWQLREMLDAGWTLGCHAYASGDLSQLTEEELHEEMQQVDSAFAAEGLPTPKHHAYPKGVYNSLIISVVSQYRYTMRTTGAVGSGSPFSTWDGLTWHTLKGCGADGIENDATFNSWLGLLRDVAEAKGILVPYFHGMTPQRTGNFIRWLDYATMLGFQFVTMDELYTMVNQYREINQ